MTNVQQTLGFIATSYKRYATKMEGSWQKDSRHRWNMFSGHEVENAPHNEGVALVLSKETERTKWVGNTVVICSAYGIWIKRPPFNEILPCFRCSVRPIVSWPVYSLEVMWSVSHQQPHLSVHFLASIWLDWVDSARELYINVPGGF